MDKEMNKEAKSIVNSTFEKIAKKEERRRNVTARALGSAALGGLGGLTGASALAHETKGPVGLASKAGAALGALVAGGASMAKNVRHNRKLEEKNASDIVSESFEKIAERMPYTLPNGGYAIPKGYMPAEGVDNDDVEGTWENNYYRKEGEVPSHYKRIADAGNGDGLFVDTKSDKNNPDYYEYYGGAGLYGLADSLKNQLFSTEDVSENYNKLKAKGLNTRDSINALTADQLREIGYTDPTFKDKAKSVGRMIKSSAKAIGIPALLGAGLAVSNSSAMTPKQLGKAALIGGGLGAIPGAAMQHLTGGFKLDDSAKARQRKLKSEMISNMYKDEENEDFLKQYKTASEIINDIYETMNK